MDVSRSPWTDAWMKLLKSDRRFSGETYRFVKEAIDFALSPRFARMIAEERPEDDEEIVADPEVLSPLKLCRAAVIYAVAEYGYMARKVLEKLGLYTTGDIGDAVYNMIRAGFLLASPEDSRADFDELLNLGEELDSAFAFHYEKRRR